MTRSFQRSNSQLRPVTFEPGYLPHAEGSCMVSFGNTKVLCAASVEERVPGWMSGSGKGWVTAEYSMLPRATGERNQREVNRGKPGGRTMEIQRLIGRALRAVVQPSKLPEVSITVDCDVIVADGGTRTASITGAWVALAQAIGWMHERGILTDASFVTESVAAVSVGIVGGVPMIDLDYSEDSTADVDMNIVMTSSGGLVEVQGTAEGDPFSRDQLDEMLGLAQGGILELTRLQTEALG